MAALIMFAEASGEAALILLPELMGMLKKKSEIFEPYERESVARIWVDKPLSSDMGRVLTVTSKRQRRPGA